MSISVSSLNHTVSEVWNLKPLSLLTSNNLGRNNSLDKIPNSLLSKIKPLNENCQIPIGVEIEVENVSSQMIERASLAEWISVEESSLRNSGSEFLHAPDIPLQTMRNLICLYLYCFAAPSKPDFSWRTGAHVHFNGRDMTLQQVLNTAILFIFCEDALNTYLPEDRQDSTFSIPLHQSYMPSQISLVLSGQQTFPTLIKNWKKYSALNLRTIGLCDHHGDSKVKGSIEFRSFPGTQDLNQLFGWINLLIRINMMGRQIGLGDLEKLIMQIKTKTQYCTAMKTLFDSNSELLDFSSLNKGSIQSLLAAKDCFLPSFNEQALAKYKTETGLQHAIKLKMRKIKKTRKELGLATQSILNKPLSTAQVKKVITHATWPAVFLDSLQPQTPVKKIS